MRYTYFQFANLSQLVADFRVGRVKNREFSKLFPPCKTKNSM